jgi:hypothetical protein
MPQKKAPLPSHARTSEKATEHYFCQQMRALGLPCIKQFNPYEVGWPDRLVPLPGGRVIWVEFKSKGEKPTAVQNIRHKTLRDLRHDVEVVSCREEAESLCEEIEYMINLF